MQLTGGTDDVPVIASFNATSMTSSSSLSNSSRCAGTTTSQINGRLTPQQSKGAAVFIVQWRNQVGQGA